MADIRLIIDGAEVRVTEASPVGVVSMDFHFAESPVNRLTNPALDPVVKIPEFKFAQQGGRDRCIRYY